MTEDKMLNGASPLKSNQEYWLVSKSKRQQFD
jgi:hypothetical protein